MKKTLIIFLSLVLMLTFAACGEKNGGKSPSESSAPAETGNAPSSEAGADENRYYGIGEAAEADSLSITIDKVESPDSDIFLNGPKDGFAYIKVYFTFKNISNETIKTPKRQAIYIVYEEGPTGDDCDMTSDKSSEDVLPGKKEGIYNAFTELASGESVSGWMVYPRQSDKAEVTMHYYSRFVNVPPDLRFSFAVE